MPARHVPGADLQYYLIPFDEKGNERLEGDGSLLSRTVCERLQSAEVTDIFVIAHGWKGDIPGAIAQYDAWITAMAQVESDVASTRRRIPGFTPLIVAPHWPSLCFGDEDIPAARGLLLGSAGEGSIASELDTYAKRISDTSEAREAISTILEQSRQESQGRLSPSVRAAYERLFAEAGLAVSGPAGAPGTDQDGFDAEAIIDEARRNPPPGSASQGAAVLGLGDTMHDLVLMPLRQLSFWTMKHRARRFGETGGHRLLAEMQRSAPNARCHLMGHSFGCIVASAMVAGQTDRERLPRPIDSLFLVQGALSLWSFANRIPYAPDSTGYFYRVIRDGLVSGPIVTTRSTKDTAVGYFYPLGAQLKRQLILDDYPWPKYGGVGSFGIQGLTSTEDRPMLPAQSSYLFYPGGIYNLEASDVIRNGGGASGAHSDIAHPEVAHAFWSAMLASATAGMRKSARPPHVEHAIPGGTRGGLLSPDERGNESTGRVEEQPPGEGQPDRWFNAELEDRPATVVVGAWYTLAIDVDVARRSEAAAPVPPIPFPDGVDEVRLTIQADSTDFDIAYRVAYLRLPRTGPSRGKARFEIAPLHNGPSKIRATIHKDGNFIQQLDLTFAVGVPQESRPVELKATGRPPSAAATLRSRDVGISLTPVADGYECTVWQAVQSNARLAIERAYLASAIDQLRRELMKIVTYRNSDGEYIFQTAVDIPKGDCDAALKVMARAGAELFQKLFFGPAAGADSQAIGEWLAKSAMDRTKRLKLQVLSASAPIPWQMLYVGELAAPPDWDNFLGMRHVIEQIPFQANLAGCEPEIPSDQPALSVSVNVDTTIDEQIPGTLVSRQQSFWSKTQAGRKHVAVKSRSTSTELIEALSDGRTDDQIVYFFCHAATAGLSDPGGPDASSLVLSDGRLTLSDLRYRAPAKTALAGKPLVFLNACESAELSPAFYDGFVPYFMQKGARGVIGTECKTPALFAEAWAERFFQEFLDGAPIGEVFLNLRREFLERHGNPLGLLYAVHCDGDVQITPALAAVSA
jgi:CHAT domain